MLMFVFAVGFVVDVVDVVLRFGFRFWLVFVFAKGKYIKKVKKKRET